MVQDEHGKEKFLHAVRKASCTIEVKYEPVSHPSLFVLLECIVMARLFYELQRHLSEVTFKALVSQMILKCHF